MQKVTFPASALYGDHHVLEVRRILLALPGVLEVYASSCFHVIEVGFDPGQVSSENIASKLEQAGYLPDVQSFDDSLQPLPRRRTVMHEQTRTAIGFKQEVSINEGSAWPCPGMGLLKVKEG